MYSAHTTAPCPGLVALSYRIYRRGLSTDWVVFVPGAGAASAIWRRQIPVFSSRYNLLVLDLPGHGRSSKSEPGVIYTFDSIAQQVVVPMDIEQIPRAHFVAMSLGCLVVEAIALREPKRLHSMVMAGGVTKLNAWADGLMRFGHLTKNWVPYMWLYRMFAWTIMPGARHRRTRRVFCSHAKRLSRGEFLRWYDLAHEVRSLMARAEERRSFIPTLFIMGADDYMFGRYVRDRTRKRSDTRAVFLPHCGHVCSVESPNEFNKIALDFLGELTALARN